MNMESDNSLEGPINILNGGLFSPFPIPAYQILIKAKEHSAKNVLLCFVSHLGMAKSSNCVWPSITTICKETKHTRTTVVRAYRTLVEFGFVRIGKYKTPHGWGNKYYIQNSCYHFSQMSYKALRYSPIFGYCEACNGFPKDGEVGSGLDAFVHYRCGGNVKKFDWVKRELFMPENTMEENVNFMENS